MENLFNSILKKTFENLGAISIRKPLQTISYDILYRFPNGAWFACSFDQRDHYLEIHLGDLYEMKDVMPRILVLGELSWYVDALNELEIFPIKHSISNDLKESFLCLKEYIEIIINHYGMLNKQIQENIMNEKHRLKKYLGKNISDNFYYNQEESVVMKHEKSNLELINEKKRMILFIIKW